MVMGFRVWEDLEISLGLPICLPVHPREEAA